MTDFAKWVKRGFAIAIGFGLAYLMAALVATLIFWLLFGW